MKEHPADLNLAVIGNCQIAALIDDHARIVWACLPTPDGDPIFSALLAARGEAREHFTRLLARRNPLGLLSEDIDPVSGELWGTYPQTYSMVGVIASAIRLSRSWEDAL